jgi:hypothetical protein
MKRGGRIAKWAPRGFLRRAVDETREVELAGEKGAYALARSPE